MTGDVRPDDHVTPSALVRDEPEDEPTWLSQNATKEEA